MKWISASIKVFILSTCFFYVGTSTAFAVNEMGEVRVDGSSTVFLL